jgi:hypothetical protein
LKCFVTSGAVTAEGEAHLIGVEQREGTGQSWWVPIGEEECFDGGAQEPEADVRLGGGHPSHGLALRLLLGA